MSNPTKNINLGPSKVDNDDAEDQQPSDGEKEDVSSNKKVNPVELKLNRLEKTLQREVINQTIRRC